MTDTTPAPRLELRWRPVVDERGRTRLMAQWVDASAAARPLVTHAA